jgi:hypothetical protein
MITLIVTIFLITNLFITSRKEKLAEKKVAGDGSKSQANN